jgi:arginine repressor
MNQKQIEVLLTVVGESDVLNFILDQEKPDEYVVNLNSDTSQSELKKVFSKLLELIIENDVKLVLKIAEGYSKVLYMDVCTVYIDDLNREISSVAESVRKYVS